MKKVTIIATLLASVFANNVMAENANTENSSGFIVGVGLEHNKMKKTGLAPGATQNFNMKDDKNIGRAFVGYDAKLLDDSVIVGIELGRSFGDKKLSQTVSGQKYDYEVKPQLDLSARLGGAFTDNVVGYVRGGIDRSKTTQTTKLNSDAAKTYRSTKNNGFYGLGVEYTTESNFVIRGEWDRVKYKDNLKDDKFSISAAYKF